jgi:hypothetical protein
MSRSFLRLAVLSAVLAWAIPTAGFGRPLPEPQQLHLRLVLQWCDPHGLFEHGAEHVGRDLSKLFGAIGVELVWQTGSADSGEPAPSDTVIRIVLVRSEPSQWNLSSRAMGAVLSQDGPQSEVYVFFRPIARMLGYSASALPSRWPTVREERDLSRALSRVIAHEVLHAVLPGTSHAADGLSRARLDRASLLADRAPIDPWVAQEFRQVLAARGNARERREYRQER